jgi:hypothetical protein
MTVRIAQLGSDGPSPDDSVPAAAPEQPGGPPLGLRHVERPGSRLTEASPPDSGEAQPGEGRRALRAERQERRRLAVACALLIAVCLAITILVVSFARTRSPGAAAPIAPATAVANR